MRRTRGEVVMALSPSCSGNDARWLPTKFEIPGANVLRWVITAFQHSFTAAMISTNIVSSETLSPRERAGALARGLFDADADFADTVGAEFADEIFGQKS